MLFVLQYVMIKDFETERVGYREEHLNHIANAAEQGSILAGGAVGKPITNGLIIFSADDVQEVHKFAQEDIYYTAGIVTSYTVQPWHIVVGNERFRV